MFRKSMKNSVTINFLYFIAKKLKIIFGRDIMETLGDKFCKNSALKFYCVFCDYNTSRKSSYDDHLLSAKHKKQKNDYNNDTKSAAILPKKNDISVEEPMCLNNFICSCGKKYKHRQGLWRHKKTCNTNNISKQTQETTSDKELIQFLMKESSEFKQLILEQSKQMTELAKKVGNNNTSNIVNNNQQFNLNFYLNETCKNAMNIMDFVSSLQVGIKELEETGRLGYAEGISKIFIDGLKQMNVNDRPIHCSDVKRETLYIKNNNEWNKETDNKVILTNAIKHVAHKNMKNIGEWTKIHPEYKHSMSKENDRYLKIVSESMSGSTDEETNKNYTKIIKNIAKETVIDKASNDVL